MTTPQLGMSTWHQVLDLALLYGWQPAGTIAPRFEMDDEEQQARYDKFADEWPGIYDSNHLQSVTAADAAALADALERALPDIRETRRV